MNSLPSKATSIYFNELVYTLKSRDIEITTLSLGEAFFKLPSLDFSDYSIDELVHYTSSRGHPRLLNTLVSVFDKYYKCNIFQQNLMVTAGSKIAIYMALLYSIQKNKRRVAVIEPAWLSYHEQIKIAGGVPVFYSWDTQISDVIKKLTREFGAIVLNNPNNPRGNLISEESFKSLLSHCDVLGINVIVDEAYSDFIHHEENFFSAAKYVNDHKNLIVVNSLSKNIGMSGFRIGYAIANVVLIEKLIRLNQHLITCAPTILQVYIADNMHQLLDITKDQISKLIQKREMIIEEVNEMGLSVLDGRNTFYFMLDVGTTEETNFDFCLKLLLYDNISVVPGIAYGESCSQFVRVSIGSEEVDEIIAALRTVSERVKSGWPVNFDSTEHLKLFDLPLYDSE